MAVPPPLLFLKVFCQAGAALKSSAGGSRGTLPTEMPENWSIPQLSLPCPLPSQLHTFIYVFIFTVLAFVGLLEKKLQPLSAIATSLIDFLPWEPTQTQT